MVRGEVPIDPVNQSGAEFVAEAFRDGLEVDAGHHGLSGEEMAQIMETNTIERRPARAAKRLPHKSFAGMLRPPR